jgi:predicted DNA-binding transcriptional regulator AlpA
LSGIVVDQAIAGEQFLSHTEKHCFAPDADLVSMKQLLARLAISRATAYRWMSQGLLPAPLKLGPSKIAFRASEIDAFLSERPRVSARYRAPVSDA